MPRLILLEPWTPGILESLIWINSLGDDPKIIIELGPIMRSTITARWQTINSTENRCNLIQ